MITHEIKPYSTALCTEVGRLRERFGATVADRVWTAAVEKNKLDGRRISVSTLGWATMPPPQACPFSCPRVQFPLMLNCFAIPRFFGARLARTSSDITGGATGPTLDGHGNGNNNTATVGKARRASATRPVENGDAVDAKSSPVPKPRRAAAGSAKARSGPAAGRAAVSPSSKAPTASANGSSISQAAGGGFVVKTVSASSSTVTAPAAAAATAVTAAATAVTAAATAVMAAATTASAFARPQAHVAAASAAVNGGSGSRWPAAAVETLPAWMFTPSVPMQQMQQSNVWNTVYPRQPATAVQQFTAPPFAPSSTVTTAPVHPEVIARACAAIGGAFDVDVNVPRARVSEESGAVQARTRYTGLAALSQPWTGNVWGNLVCVPDLSVFAVGESASATGGEGLVPVGGSSGVGRRLLEIETPGPSFPPRGRRAEEDEFVSAFLMSARRRFAVGEFSHAIFLAPYRPAATWWSLVADAPHACLVVHPFWPPLPERITDVFVFILLTRGPVTIVNSFCHTFGSIGYIPGMSTAHVAAQPHAHVAPQQ